MKKQTFTEWVIDHPGSEWVVVLASLFIIFSLFGFACLAVDKIEHTISKMEACGD